MNTYWTKRKYDQRVHYNIQISKFNIGKMINVICVLEVCLRNKYKFNLHQFSFCKYKTDKVNSQDMDWSDERLEKTGTYNFALHSKMK